MVKCSKCPAPIGKVLYRVGDLVYCPKCFTEDFGGDNIENFLDVYYNNEKINLLRRGVKIDGEVPLVTVRDFDGAEILGVVSIKLKIHHSIPVPLCDLEIYVDLLNSGDVKTMRSGKTVVLKHIPVLELHLKKGV